MTPAQQIAYDRAQIMLAFAEGKRIERRSKNGIDWSSCELPNWDWDYNTFRIAREPRVVWVLFNSDGCVLGGPAFEGRQGWTEFREVFE